MNTHRYIQIILTCLIAGTITFALRQNKPCCPCTLKDKALLESESNATSTPEDEKKASKIEASSIIIEPNISSKDLSYKHGFLSYSPTSIALTINDKEIEINNYDPITITIDSSNAVTSRCKYKFIAGYEGEIVSVWKVKPGEKHTVNFNWKTPEKIQIEGAVLASTRKGSEVEEDEEDEDDEDESSTSETTLAAAPKPTNTPNTKDRVESKPCESKNTTAAVKKETAPTALRKSA